MTRKILSVIFVMMLFMSWRINLRTDSSGLAAGKELSAVSQETEQMPERNDELKTSNEIAELQRGNRNYRILLYLALLVIFSLVIYNFYLLRMKMTVKFREEILKRKNLERELGARIAEYEGELKKRTEDFTSFTRQIQQSQKQYKYLVENIQEGMVIVDREENFLFVNRAAVEIFGAPVDELIGKSLSRFLNQDDYNLIIQQTDIRKKGISSKYDMVIKRLDGQIRFVRISASPVMDEGEYLGSQAILVDITEQKKNENIQSVIFNISNSVITSRSLDDLYSAIHRDLGLVIDTTNFYIALYDDVMDIITAPYYVDEMNPLTPEPQKLGRGLTAYVIRSGKPLLVTPEIRQRMITEGKIPEASWQSMIWLGVPLKIENRIIGAMAVQSYSNPDLFSEQDLRILEFVSDQIALAIIRKRTEKALQDSETFNRAIIDNSPLGISARDKKGRLIVANKAWMKIWGKTEQDLQKDYLSRQELKFNERDNYLGEYLPEVKQIYETGGELHIPEMKLSKIPAADSRAVWISQYFYAIMNENRQVDKVIIITEDITERKLAAERIEASLREKEVLLKEVHHRVKNNMQIISSMLKLQSDYIRDPEALDLFKDSQNRVKSMALIHEKLYQSESFERLDFDQYARVLINYLLRSFNVDTSRIQVEIKIDNVFMDITRAIPLGLIINELVSNSLKHAFPENRQGIILIALEHTPPHYRLQIRDDGIGFPPDLDYRQTESLGLQLIIALTSQIHAEITLNREAGTDFILKFPDKAVEKSQ